MDNTNIKKLEELLGLYKENEIHNLDNDESRSHLSSIEKLIKQFNDLSELFSIACKNKYQNVIDYIIGNNENIGFTYAMDYSLFVQVCLKNEKDTIKHITQLKDKITLGEYNLLLSSNINKESKDIIFNKYHEQIENTRSNLCENEDKLALDFVDQNKFIGLILELEKYLPKYKLRYLLSIWLSTDNNNIINSQYNNEKLQEYLRNNRYNNEELQEYLNDEKIKEISKIFNDNEELLQYASNFFNDKFEGYPKDTKNEGIFRQKIVLYEILRKYSDEFKPYGLKCLVENIEEKKLNHNNYYFELDFLIKYYENIYINIRNDTIRQIIVFLTLKSNGNTYLDLIKNMIKIICSKNEDRIYDILNYRIKTESLDVIPINEIFVSFRTNLEDIKFFTKLNSKYKQLINSNLLCLILLSSTEKTTTINYLIEEYELDLNAKYDFEHHYLNNAKYDFEHHYLNNAKYDFEHYYLNNAKYNNEYHYLKDKTLLEHSLIQNDFDLFKALLEKGAILNRETLNIIFDHFDRYENLFDYLENNCRQHVTCILKNEIKLLKKRTDSKEFVSICENDILKNKTILNKIFEYISPEERKIFCNKIALETIINTCDLESFIFLINNNILPNSNITFFEELFFNKSNSTRIFDYIVHNKKELLNNYLIEFSKLSDIHKIDLIYSSITHDNIDIAKEIIKENIITIEEKHFIRAKNAKTYIDSNNKTANFIVQTYNQQIQKQKEEELKKKKEEELIKQKKLLEDKQNIINKLNTIIKNKNIVDNDITIDNINENLINNCVPVWYSFTSAEQLDLHNCFKFFGFDTSSINKLLNEKQIEFIHYVSEKYNINANISRINELIAELAKIDNIFVNDQVIIADNIYNGFNNLFGITKEDLDNRLLTNRRKYNKNRKEQKIKELYIEELKQKIKKNNIRFDYTIDLLNEYIDNTKYMIDILNFCKSIVNEIGFIGNELEDDGYKKYGECIYNFFTNINGILSLFQQNEISNFNQKLDDFKKAIENFGKKIEKVKNIKCNYNDKENLNIEKLTTLNEEFNNFNINMMELNNLFNNLITNFNNIFQEQKLNFEFHKGEDNLEILYNLIIQKLCNYYKTKYCAKGSTTEEVAKQLIEDEHYRKLRKLMQNLKDQTKNNLPNIIKRDLKDDTKKSKTIEVQQNIERKKTTKRINQEKEEKEEKEKREKKEKNTQPLRIQTQQNKKQEKTKIKILKPIKLPPVKIFIRELLNENNIKTNKYNTNKIDKNDPQYDKAVLLNSLIDLFNEKENKNTINELLDIVITNYDTYINSKAQYKKNDTLKHFKKIRFFELLISSLQVIQENKELNIKIKKVKEGYEQVLYAIKKKRNKFVYDRNNVDTNILLMLDNYKQHEKMLNDYKQHEDLLEQYEKKLQTIRNAYFLKIYQNIVDLDINVKNMIDSYKYIKDVSTETKRYYTIQSLPDNNITKIVYNEFRELRNNVIHNFYNITEEEFAKFTEMTHCLLCNNKNINAEEDTIMLENALNDFEQATDEQHNDISKANEEMKGAFSGNSKFPFNN